MAKKCTKKCDERAELIFCLKPVALTFVAIATFHLLFYIITIKTKTGKAGIT